VASDSRRDTLIDTEFTVPLSALVALIRCYTPFDLASRYMPADVSGVNSRTIDRARVFVAACEDPFIPQNNGEIITSARFIAELEGDRQRSRACIST
jgi:hypothetical protein